MSNKTVLSLLMLVLVAALLTIDSCKPKNEQAVIPDSLAVDSLANSPCILLSERINDVLYRAYEYDSSRQLLRLTEYSGNPAANRITKKYRFDYEKKQLIRLTETNLTDRDQSFIYEMDYDTDGKLEKIRPFRVFNSGPRAVDTLAVVYNDKNYITELNSVTTGSSKWEYDSVGNVKKWLIRLPIVAQDSILAEYNTYDDKTNLYGFSKDIQLLRLLNGNAPSRRNPLRYTFKGNNIESIYQYNPKGVPMQSILKIKSVSDSTFRETVFTYQLDCK